MLPCLFPRQCCDMDVKKLKKKKKNVNVIIDMEKIFTSHIIRCILFYFYVSNGFLHLFKLDRKSTKNEQNSLEALPSHFHH